MSVLGRSDKVILTIMEVVEACFRTKNVLKYNCRGSLMLVDSYVRAGKIR